MEDISNRKKRRIKWILKIMKERKNIIMYNENEKKREVIFHNQIYEILNKIDVIKGKEKIRYINPSFVSDLSNEQIVNVITENEYTINIDKLQNSNDLID